MLAKNLGKSHAAEQAEGKKADGARKVEPTAKTPGRE